MAAYVVWDWNGTLFDDVALCIQVMNGMLEKRGLPRLAGPEQYRQVFTFPVEEYYKALGFDFGREPFSQLAVEYISEYDRRALGCPLRAGAEAALAELRRRGVKQVIASASHKKALEEQVAHLGVAGYFQALLGVEDSLGRGKSGLAGDFLRQAGAGSDALFVGDTLHDFETAAALGCPCALLTGGHQARPRLEATGAPVLDTFPQLLALPQLAGR